MPPLDTKCSPAFDRRPSQGRVGSPSGPNLQAAQPPSPFPIPHSPFPRSDLRSPISDLRSPGAQRPSAPRSSISHLLSSERRAAAFTLLEVLVASAIMGIVMFVLVSTANTSLQLWRGTSEKIAVDREGRMGLHLLAYDLDHIVIPSWPLPRTITITNTAPELSMFSTTERSNFARFTNFLPRVQTNNNSPDTIRLAFLVQKPRDYQTNPATDLGDVCYVEYRFFSNALWRGFAGSASVFSSITNTNSGFRFSPIPSPTNDPSRWQALATNLYQFRVWGHSDNSATPSFDNFGARTTFSNFWRLARQEVVTVGNATQTNRTFAYNPLAGIEYQMEVVDQKFMKMYRSNPQLAEAMRYRSRKYYQAMQPVQAP